MMLPSPLAVENLHPKMGRFFPRSASGCIIASDCDIEREPALSAGYLLSNCPGPAAVLGLRQH
jgi:hypothetical protein